MTLLPPPADTLVPIWHWLLATWFGAGILEPLRAGLAVASASVVVIALRKNALAVPAFGILILVAGVFVSTTIGDASGMKDDRRIVIDEVAAFVLGAAFLRGFHWTALAPFAALFLFIDRIKPWPFYHFEALPSGWGVMADDLGLGLILGTIFLAALTARGKRQNA